MRPTNVQSAGKYARCESLNDHDYGLLRGIVLDVFQADQHQASDALGFAKAVRRLMVVPNPAPPTRARSTSRWSTKEMTSSAYCAQVCRAGSSHTERPYPRMSGRHTWALPASRRASGTRLR